MRRHRSFRRIVSYITQQLGLVEDETVVKAIVSARNSLFHTRQFLSIKDSVKAKEFGFVDAGRESFNLLSFVDQILFRVVRTAHSASQRKFSSSPKRCAHMFVRDRTSPRRPCCKSTSPEVSIHNSRRTRITIDHFGGDYNLNVPAAPILRRLFRQRLHVNRIS